ncbi:hypothetical protein RhiJN_11301 [Ceratobasidium sp. AG-Ba]|nr:hypothetical protein RhiJN_11301 [Ceratobasidium sp. AG-Ba]QRW12021.1 hypothetical protein RhiLY_11020 [Ceratobasidium sp. AG-Ba]
MAPFHSRAATLSSPPPLLTRIFNKNISVTMTPVQIDPSHYRSHSEISIVDSSPPITPSDPVFPITNFPKSNQLGPPHTLLPTPTIDEK